MNNKIISIVMLDKRFLNKQMKDLPGLVGVEEEMPGVPGVEEDETDSSFKDGYLKGYEQGLKDALKEDK